MFLSLGNLILLFPQGHSQREGGNSLRWVLLIERGFPTQMRDKRLIKIVHAELAPSPGIQAADSWELRVLMELGVLVSNP